MVPIASRPLAAASRLLLGVTLLTLPACGPSPAPSPAPVPASAPAARPAPGPLDGAELVGRGPISAWRRGPELLLAIPQATIGRPLLWNAEVAGVPAGMVANYGLGITTLLVRLERQGGVVHVRDLSTANQRRAGVAPSPVPTPASGDPFGERTVPPIEVALGSMETGALMLSLPIKGTSPDGELVVDATAAFSGDIATASAKPFFALGGVATVAVDPSKSYVDGVRVTPRSLDIRSHLTFLTATSPLLPNTPASIVVAHSIVVLPETPMRARPADPRVGFFSTQFVEYEPGTGPTLAGRSVISRFRLEKRDPAAPVSDPVTPITYYLGPGIPERWRPHVRAGILEWLPAFEAAGFSNAIRVLDAPTPAQDPTWSAEDLTINVVRWVPEERVNAMGPSIVDPRSGEILGAHILIWPTVIDWVGQYYFAFFGGGVDPAAAHLPLPEEKSGAILRYIVAHEVGHTLGLLHNQLASTAWSVAQLRDPAFANRHGPNASIMAYGRFNQAAQPGDGVTQLWSVLGAYDVAAIRYGYGDFGRDAAAEAPALARFAETFTSERRYFYGSKEGPERGARFARDPRVQVENVGAERVEATRLGVANIQRSLARLPEATAGNEALFRSTYDVLLDRHVALLHSVADVVGGTMPRLEPGAGPAAAYVPAADQRQAVRWLLGDGVRSLEAYQRPELVDRIAPVGGYRVIDAVQAGTVSWLLTGPNVALLESQRGRDGDAYSSLDLGRDVTAAVWGDLRATTFSSRALQRGYLDAARRMLAAWAARGTKAAEPLTLSVSAVGPQAPSARLDQASGDDTLFPAWLRGTLASLEKRTRAASRSASSETDRLHYADMATEITRLLAIGNE